MAREHPEPAVGQIWTDTSPGKGSSPKRQTRQHGTRLIRIENIDGDEITTKTIRDYDGNEVNSDKVTRMRKQTLFGHYKYEEQHNKHKVKAHR